MLFNSGFVSGVAGSEWIRRLAGGRRSMYIVGLDRRVGKVKTGGRQRGSVDLKSFVRTCGVDRRFLRRAAAWSDAGRAVLDRVISTKVRSRRSGVADPVGGAG